MLKHFDTKEDVEREYPFNVINNVPMEFILDGKFYFEIWNKEDYQGFINYLINNKDVNVDPFF